jgi:hypothetical protein
MPGTRTEDAYGHVNPTTATALTAGAVSTTVAGTIAPTTSAGASPTVTFATGQVATDSYGSYTLSPVTGGSAQAAGATSVVTFLNPYGKAPMVLVTVVNDSGPVAVAAKAINITSAGFSVSTSLLVTANTYTVTYQVLPLP